MGFKIFLLSGFFNAFIFVVSGLFEIEGKSVRVGLEGLDLSLCFVNVYLEVEIIFYS